jgi:nuclear GTP-binding protein
MAKKKEKAVNVSGKPRHSNDVNRPNDKKGAGGGAGGGARSAATVRRLQMYKTRPKRDRSGKVLRNEFQSKELPNTRIEPDRRWFSEQIAPSPSRPSLCLYALNWPRLVHPAL